MKILHVSSEYPPQQIFGLGRYVSDLSTELVAQGHEVHVLTNSHGGEAQDVEEKGVHVHRVDFPPPPKPAAPGAPVMAFNLHLQQRSAILGRKGLGDPDVVVSHDWLTALAAHRISRRWGVPHVWTVHDTVYGKRSGHLEDPDDRFAFRVEEWASRAADLVLVNSQAVRDEVERHYRARSERVELLHPGIEESRCRERPDETRLAAFRTVFAAPDEILVTYCGRLDVEKGIDTLVNAFAAVRRSIPMARLAIAGRGRLQPMIEEHIRRMGLEGAADLYGYLEGDVLRAFYHVSDIHVCPSHYEPFGLVAVEAMATGTPVIASASGGLVDILSSPEVGRSVPPRDISALTGALLELASDPALRARLGAAGREHVRRRFSWTRLAKRAVAHYRSASLERVA